jgi:hypothetical protein
MASSASPDSAVMLRFQINVYDAHKFSDRLNI